MKNRFHQILFKTPDSWGNESYYLTPEQAFNAVQEMTDCLQRECSIDECEQLDLVRQIDNETALYDGEGHHDGGYRNYRRFGYILSKTADNYEFIKQLDTSDECTDGIKKQAAASLGSIKSNKKANSSAANGAKGGRPRKQKTE